MTCVVCGQGLIEAARAPRQPDRHRWCSAKPGRVLAPRKPLRWTEPLDEVMDEAELEWRTLEAEAS